MNMRARLSPEDYRQRIMEVAEEHFRRVGYAKTAVADIAAELGMSAANIYRYFPSKAAINEAICGKLLDGAHHLMAAVVAEDRPADEKLAKLLLTLAAYNAEVCATEKRLHDMVEAALDENWPTIGAHLEHVVKTVAGVIAEGIATGVFAPVEDVAKTALTVKQACSCILHPSMIAWGRKCGISTPDQPARIVSFVVDALRA
jgi:AcrR family transcriptional regulator